jgi:limonene-1,2-epoxide hydrolase
MAFRFNLLSIFLPQHLKRFERGIYPMDRRAFLPASIFGVLALADMPSAAAAAQITEAEQANLKLVSDMVAAWDIAAALTPPDLGKLRSFFADDCAFRLRPTDTAPVRGFEVVEAAIQRGTANGQKIHHELLDRFAKGPVVAMEKLNQFSTPEKTRTSHVVAVFILKDGKITEWTEYFISAA